MSKILLVAGHGQGDPGAGGGGYNEANTMRDLVNKIKKLIPNDVDVYNTALNCYTNNGLQTTTYKNVIEFHMDGAANTDAKGGHVIISSQFSPDSLDKKLRDVIKKHIGLRSSYPDGFSKRNDLQNLNVAAKRGISYRLLELGFITNSSDRAKTIGKMDELAKLIAEAITGKSVGGGSNSFNINNYHTTKFKQIKIIKADYAYKEKELKNKDKKCKVGDIFTVTDLVYSGKYPRFKLKSGLYITARKDTVSEYKAAAATYHTVKSGENLTTIAKKYGTTWQAIQKLNGLKDPNKLSVGQKLRVK